MHDIIEFLGLEDLDLNVTKTELIGRTRYVTVSSFPTAHFCPQCGFRMHSKGIHQRKIDHPILQDGHHLVLILNQRRWRCTNPECGFTENEHFRFVDRYRRSTNATDLLILEAFRDISNTASAIGERFHKSDQHVLDVFDRYVSMKRLPLTDVISVDEVHLEMDAKCKYALVLQDFHTGEPIDLVISRRKEVTEPYFSSIPIQERASVKYLISDMYAPYQKFVEQYFPNAKPVVDAFHVIHWITHSIEQYLRGLLRNFKQRDGQKWRERHPYTDPEFLPPMPQSDEVYLLQKYRWLILSNRSSIEYHQDVRMDRHFHRYMNTYDYERKFMALTPAMQELRDLKEEYVMFNQKNSGDPHQAALELPELIRRYKSSEYAMFRDFAGLLDRYKQPIINSFILTERIGPGGIYDSRMSNGPIESLNRKAKDLKRIGRGYRNFSHLRNRFLFAARKRPTLIGYCYH